jgi:hypothetical protein
MSQTSNSNKYPTTNCPQHRHLDEDYRRNQHEQYQNTNIYPNYQSCCDLNVPRNSLVSRPQHGVTFRTSNTSSTYLSTTDDEEIARQLQEEEFMLLLDPLEEHPYSSRQQIQRDEEYARRLQEEDERLIFSPPIQMPSPFTGGSFEVFYHSNANRNGFRANFLRSLLARRRPEVLFAYVHSEVNDSSNDMEGTPYGRLLRFDDLPLQVPKRAQEHTIQSIPTRQYRRGGALKEADKCTICLSDFNEGEDVSTLPVCLHSFHQTCLAKWLSINSVCPICRLNVEEMSSTSHTPPRR